VSCYGGSSWKCNRYKNTLQIPKETEIGYGLYIGHGGPVIINGSAKIGNNCNLSQFTTIGSNEGYAAEIGDNVTNGAGSVVTKDIPSNATAAGNYARVLNYCNPGRYIRNKWSLDKWDIKYHNDSLFLELAMLRFFCKIILCISSSFSH